MANTTEIPETKIGTNAICKSCGNEIEYVNPYWRHTGDWTPRHIAIPEDTIPDVAELQRQNAVLKALFRKLFDEASWTVYDTIQNEAREGGVIIPHEVTQEDIDDVRFDNGECELGDTVYVMSDWMQSDTAKIPIPSKVEVAREFMDDVSLRVDDTGMRFEGAADDVLKEWEDAESKTNSI